MEIAGAAYATGIGQTVTFLVYVIVYAAGKLPVKGQPQEAGAGSEAAVSLYGVGIPATLNMALPSLADLCAERDPGGILPELRSGAGSVLQAADVYLSDCKRNHPGNQAAGGV